MREGSSGEMESASHLVLPRRVFLKLQVQCLLVCAGWGCWAVEGKSGCALCPPSPTYFLFRHISTCYVSTSILTCCIRPSC